MSPHSPDLPIPAPPEEQSAPEALEGSPTVEKKTIEAFLNHVSARTAAESVKKSAFDPEATLDPNNEELKNRFTEWFSNKTTETKNFRAGEALSEDSRRTTTEKRLKELEEKAKKEGTSKTHDELKKELHDEWNGDVRGWIKRKAKTADRDETIAALNALGMGIDGNNIQGDLSEDQEKDLETKVNKFYADYLEGGSGIEKFVVDIAEDLKENGHVDLGRLDKRLTALQGLLPTFGEEMKDENGKIVPIEIKKLVDAYARRYAIQTQDKATKKVAGEVTFDHLAQPVPEGPDRQLFLALHKKNEELKNKLAEAQEPEQTQPEPVQQQPEEGATPSASEPIPATVPPGTRPIEDVQLPEYQEERPTTDGDEKQVDETNGDYQVSVAPIKETTSEESTETQEEQNFHVGQTIYNESAGENMTIDRINENGEFILKYADGAEDDPIKEEQLNELIDRGDFKLKTESAESDTTNETPADSAEEQTEINLQTQPEDEDQKAAREAGITVDQVYEIISPSGKKTEGKVDSIKGDNVYLKVKDGEADVILPIKISSLQDEKWFKRIENPTETPPTET